MSICWHLSFNKLILHIYSLPGIYDSPVYASPGRRNSLVKAPLGSFYTFPHFWPRRLPAKCITREMRLPCVCVTGEFLYYPHYPLPCKCITRVMLLPCVGVTGEFLHYPHSWQSTPRYMHHQGVATPLCMCHWGVFFYSISTFDSRLPSICFTRELVCNSNIPRKLKRNLNHWYILQNIKLYLSSGHLLALSPLEHSNSD